MISKSLRVDSSGIRIQDRPLRSSLIPNLKHTSTQGRGNILQVSPIEEPYGILDLQHEYSVFRLDFLAYSI